MQFKFKIKYGLSKIKSFIIYDYILLLSSNLCVYLEVNNYLFT